MRVKTIILFLLSCSRLLHGQTEFKFKYITVDQGLSSNRVFSVYRDSRQFLWIGTDMGLNKYDGYQTIKYLSDGVAGSISNNSLRCVIEDVDGNIWAGTEGGLNLYNRATDSFIVFKYDSMNENSISSDNINSLYRDKAGTLWIFAGGNCLNRWEPNERKFIRYQFKGDDNAYYNASNSIAEDSKGNIWVGSYAPGLFCLKPNTDKLIHLQSAEINFGDRDTKSLYIDENDIIWIASNGSGFHSFNPSTGHVEHFPQREDGSGPNQELLRWILPEDERFLLIAANQGGINRFDKKKKTFEYITYNPENGTGINNNGVWTFHRDKEGILWVGTGNGGVNYYNPKEYNFKVYSQGYDKTHSPSSNTIGGFYEDSEGMIWIATDGEGINVFNPKDESFKVFKHDPDNPFTVSGNTIRNIIEDDRKNLWIATWDAGLNRYDRLTGRFYRFKADGGPASISGVNVWQVKMDHRGLFWLSIMEEGVDIFDRNRGVIKRFTVDPQGLGTDVIWQFFEEKEKYMWICTWKGLYRYAFETEQFTGLKNFPDNDIRTLYKDTKGNYWLGSFNKGLFKIDFNGNILAVYDDKNGLPNNQIHAIVEDDVGDLWISTNYGLSRFNPQQETFKITLKMTDFRVINSLPILFLSLVQENFISVGLMDLFLFIRLN